MKWSGATSAYMLALLIDAMLIAFAIYRFSEPKSWTPRLNPHGFGPWKQTISNNT
jgi:hypothetical protein